MRLDKIDLNLFKAFDTIYAERSLTRAGEILHVTQPAMSNTLRRLREAFKDQLFVRTTEGMLPTPVADNMIGRVREALQLLDSSLSAYDKFVPASSDKTFRVCMGDQAEALFLPIILNRIEKLAPNIRLRIFTLPRQDLPLELANNKIDVAIEPPLLSDPQLLSTPILNDEHICVLRKDHPMANQALDIESYLRLSHIHLSSRRRGIGQVDLALKGLGRKRQISVRAQHYLVAPLIIADTDLALSIPASLARILGLSGMPLPFEVPPLQLHLFWHKSADNDPANKWLRQLFTNVTKLKQQEYNRS